ncbi:craniofacial development protein 2-like [Palaemon carinicauda]|uniref:craniofacial development protein 2-like n=1 Tax=Palaemon carinicauda TaxID=392227 RepID=UPI0035B674AA
MMMTARAEKALTERRAVNSRLLIAKFKSLQCNIHTLVCYAPTNYSPVERNNEYYKQLQGIIDDLPDRDMKIVIGDFNAKVGRNNQGIENVMGGEGFGEVSNENVAYFISVSSVIILVIGGTLFQQKIIHTHTWTSQCGNYKNQIDHKRRRTLRNVRSYRRADIGSDHQFLIIALKLKLKAHNREIDIIPRFDTIKLLEEEHRETFAIENSNQFAILETLRHEEQTIIEEWCDIKNIYQLLGSEVLVKSYKEKSIDSE